GACWIGVGISIWALLRSPLTPGRALAALVVVPSYWLLVEWIRSWQALGGPWALLGASQWQHPAILGPAAVRRVWPVRCASVMASPGIVILIVAPGLMVRGLGAAATAIAIAAGPAAFALTSTVHPTGFATVALVQPGIENNSRLRDNASQRLSAGLG